MFSTPGIAETVFSDLKGREQQVRTMQRTDHGRTLEVRITRLRGLGRDVGDPRAGPDHVSVRRDGGPGLEGLSVRREMLGAPGLE